MHAAHPIPATPFSDPDLALQQRFAEGDRDAFGMLVAPLLDPLYTFCLRICGRPLDAEEIAQEALERALRAHWRYDAARPFRPWLFRIALNLCRDRVRTPWWRSLLGMDSAPELVCETDPQRHMEALDDDAAVRAALLSLPPMYREAIALFHVDELAYEQMAEIVGIAVPALKQRVRRGREMMRRVLESRYPERASTRIRNIETRDDLCISAHQATHTGGSER